MKLLLLFSFLAQQAFVSPEDVFRTAEELYQNGRYAEAAEQYEMLAEQGVRDGALSYNLGNAYFKSGRLGLAILNYERALRRMPGDPDAKTNLEFANSLKADVVERPNMPSYIAWMVDLYQALDPGHCAAFLSLAFLVLGVALSVLILGLWPRLRVPAIYAVVVSGFFVMVSAGALFGKISSSANRESAIVLVPSSDVRSGPGDTNPQLVEIHEGLKVIVIGTRDEWLQVTLPNEITGWIRTEHVEII